MATPCYLETHCHTPLCGHARGRPEDYARTARRRGLAGVIVTCHNPMPAEFGPHLRMGPEDLPRYVAFVDEARRALAGEAEVHLGLEADYLPGYEAYLERQLRTAPFTYVLGSVHPQAPAFRERYGRGDPPAVMRRYFDLLAAAAETGLFDALSHPDLIKNEFPADWDPEAVRDAWEDALTRIARTGVALELNTSGRWKRVPEMNPFPVMIRRAGELGIPFVVGGDAHEPERAGEGFACAARLLRETGYTQVSLFRERRRQGMPLAVLEGRVPQGGV